MKTWNINIIIFIYKEYKHKDKDQTGEIICQKIKFEICCVKMFPPHADNLIFVTALTK